MDQRVGAAATVSIVSAIGSFIASFAGHAVLGLVLGVLAVPVGIVGTLMAGSPKVRGAIISIIAILLGLAGVGLAVLVLVGSIVL